MLCEKCNLREATIQYTEFVNGEKNEHHFCEECSSEINMGQYSTLFDGEFPLSKLLSGLLQLGSQMSDTGHRNIICPTCHMTYSDFINNSRFGCADCYEVFGPVMEGTIKRLQGAESHRGKRPKGRFGAIDDSQAVDINRVVDELKNNPEINEREKQEKELRTKIAQAVLLEEYEEAARYRDELKDLLKEEQTNAEMV